MEHTFVGRKNYYFYFGKLAIHLSGLSGLPEVSIGELTANCIIHQNFETKGFPMIEIYSDRVAISNPGQPLIIPERFIDEYVSRNEKMADLMRRANLCEKKGSGMDKIISNNEQYHLPPINILVDEFRTAVTIYAYQKLSEMSRKDKNKCLLSTLLPPLYAKRKDDQSKFA